MMDYSNLNEQQMELINKYCNDDLRLLRKICDPIINIKNTPQADYDDLYSDAMKVLLESVVTYDKDKKCSFHTFLVGNIKRSFYDWTRDNRRWKRCNLEVDKDGNVRKDESGNPIVIHNMSLDATTDDGELIFEKVDSGFDIMAELSNDTKQLFSDGMKTYLESLGKDEWEIAHLLMEGYTGKEIKSMLHFTDKKYDKLLCHMRSFEKHLMLKHNDNVYIEEDTMMNETYTQTFEKSKPDKMSIASIIKKIDNYTIRFDHPLQRSSDQWSPAMKGNLISDILQRNPIPALTFAEQIINGIAIIWDLDGKQRCTNVYSFKNDGFKISKNIRRWNIEYQSTLKDENGRPILDANGFPQSERKIFDIRNKKFSDLPDELKDIFLDYNFEITQYLNCSPEDIAYHIARYNEGKPMTSQQKGVIRLGEEFAAMVKSISAMPFFKENGSYTVKETTNGTINRVVVESIMATNFLEDWKKEQTEMCDFIKNNANAEMFDDFEDLVERISAAGNDEVFEMFNSKDSFLWFGLFGRFVKTGKDDKDFVEFMAEFSQSLHSKEINGVCFDDLCVNKETGKSKSTKDKQIVVQKMEILVALMNEYLNIDSDKTVSAEEFISEKVGIDIEDVKNDMEGYEETLNDLENVSIKDGSKLLETANRLSLLCLVAYSYKNDIDLEEWLEDYAAKNNTYFVDQAKNFDVMINSLLSFNSKMAVA